MNSINFLLETVIDDLCRRVNIKIKIEMSIIIIKAIRVVQCNNNTNQE
jgi:hypothetical protein